MHLNEQGYKFSMITTGISSHVRYLLEEKGVPGCSLSLLQSEDKGWPKRNIRVCMGEIEFET